MLRGLVIRQAHFNNKTSPTESIKAWNSKHSLHVKYRSRHGQKPSGLKKIKMEGLDRLCFLILILSLGSINACYQNGISFPITYVDSSIDFGISSEELNIPTGKCETTIDRRNDVSLILPRACAPRNLYTGFIISNRVTCLSLRQNLIESISYGAFDRLPNLFYLDLSKNRIQYCDFLSFGGHPTLSTLILDENEIHAASSQVLTIDRADYFPRLEHLYLRKNFIHRMSVSMRRHFPSLTHLYLSDNLLTSGSLNYLTDLPISLSHLHLERNRIRSLDARIIRELGYLYLDGNEITSICSSSCRNDCINLRGASRLRFLSLSRNRITRIDADSFADVYELRSLTLAYNEIENIAIGTFDRLPELADLSLSHNRLRIIPDFSRTRMLTSLTIDHNYIERIVTGTFRDLRRLKWLTLSGNRLTLIDNGAFAGLRELEELDLSDNRLDRLDWSWIDRDNRLRLLDLRGNRFATYDHLYLRDLTMLTDLYLQGNPVTSLAQPIYTDTIYRNVTVHVEYGVTYAVNTETRPCYTVCEFNHRLTQLYDYLI